MGEDTNNKIGSHCGMLHPYHIYSVNNRRLDSQHTTRISLLVLTDHPEPELVFLLFTVSKSGESSLAVTTHLPLFERSAQTAEFCHDVLVDPNGALAIVSIYTGKLKIVVLTEEGDYERDSDASLACSFAAQPVIFG